VPFAEQQLRAIDRRDCLVLSPEELAELAAKLRRALSG